MNIYNVTYPYGYGSITVTTIASNGFEAQKQIVIKNKKGSKSVFGMKGVKVSPASIEEIDRWIEMLEQAEDQEQISKIRTILARRAG